MACRLIYYNNDSANTIYRKVLLVAAPIVCVRAVAVFRMATKGANQQDDRTNSQEDREKKVSDLNLDFGVSNKNKSSSDRIERLHMYDFTQPQPRKKNQCPAITKTTEWTSVEELMRIRATGFDFLLALLGGQCSLNSILVTKYTSESRQKTKIQIKKIVPKKDGYLMGNP